MAKGLFSQGVSLLTDGQTTIEDIRSVLGEQGFDIAKQRPGNPAGWCYSGPTLVVPFLPAVNGYAAVDVVNQTWPDTMGDPKADTDTFAAWSMGHFGPLAYPGSLARARQHAWAWEQGRTAPERHRGFIRIRTSYVFGSGDDAPVLPQDYDPLAELTFLSHTVLALFQAPGVICYFNPNGEVLYDHARFRKIWDECCRQDKIPLLLWMNIRFFRLNEKLAFMDTVGNGQLEIKDVEAVFPLTKHEPGDVGYYLRNVTHYLLDEEPEIESGEAIDGPGETNLSWTVDVLDHGLIDPPRRVLRLYPKANRREIREALAAVVGPSK